MAIRIVIDRELCSGYANCLDAAPEVFDVDDHDIAVVVASDDQVNPCAAIIRRRRRSSWRRIAAVLSAG